MVKIVADTLSCLSLDLVHRLGIEYIPQVIEFSADESYYDDTGIDSATFLKKLRAASALPKTAAPPPALYNPIYEQLSAEGHTIIVVCPSSKVSGTVRSAEVAAKDFPNADIRVVDTLSVGGGLGAMVLKAYEWAKNSIDADTIVRMIHAMAAREKLIFLVDTLEYLQKGGRIGAASALIGSILQMKPILTLRQGGIETLEKQRTKKKALARVCEIILESCPRDANSHLCIMQGDAMEDALFLSDYAKKMLGATDIPIYFLPPAILVHSGPGAIGVSFFRSE